MDFLKSQLDRIQQQLAGLSASQKMLAACLVAIIVMTVAWWGRQAGRSEMVPLFQQALDPVESGQIKQLLAARGITAEIGADNLVSVPSAQFNEAFAQLAVSDAMPKNPSINFDSFMKGINPFLSQGMTDAHLIHFKQARLAEVIREFPGVKGAQVFIDATRKFGFEGSGVEPTATVHIRAKDPKAISQSIVDGAASMVLGAQAGLSWKKVTVTVNGVPRRVTDPEMRGSDAPEALALREEYQEIYAARVRNFLPIPGLSVSVTFGMNDQLVRKRVHTYDKEKTLNLESETSEKAREGSGGGAGTAGEPGAQPNIGMAVTSAAGGAAGESTFSENESKSKFTPFPSDTVEESVKGPGLTQPTGAAVLIPQSYVVKILRGNKPSAAEPDDAQVEQWCTKWLPKYQELVRSNVGLQSVSDVSIGLYPDVIPLVAVGDAAATSPTGISTASIAAVATSHSREIMLGGLALVSLFMVSMMVRKGGPAVVAVPQGVQQTVPMPVLDAGEALAGEVGEGKSMLDAMELDEDAVRAQQMVDQVAAMVEDNPDAAAGLVKRWMSRT